MFLPLLAFAQAVPPKRSRSAIAFGLGIIEGLTKYFYPEASSTVIFVIMAIVLMIRPQGLFGQR